MNGDEEKKSWIARLIDWWAGEWGADESGSPRSRKVERAGLEKNEMLAHEWTTLESLWNTCKSTVDEPERTRIQGMFPTDANDGFGRTQAARWHKFNLAEQNVGAHLREPQLTTEFRTLLGIAKERNIPSLARHEEDKKLFDDPAPTYPAERDERDGQKRAVYQALLQLLQGGFVETRFHRVLRQDTAHELFFLGLRVMIVAILTLAIYLFMHDGENLRLAAPGKGAILAAKPNALSLEPVLWLLLVGSFGALGAFFSRLLTFQSKLATLGFVDVINLYQTRVMLIRLLYGMIGALIFYLIMRSGLIAGAAMPEFQTLSAGVSGTYTVTTGAAAAATQKVPIMELAKLLTWSFLAGFSERLLPDTLTRVEGRAAEGR